MSFTSQHHSVCPLDCPDTCSLSVSVEDDKVVRVRGSSQNPFTASVICSKVSKFYPGFVHGDARLTRPLKRCGEKGSGQFEPIDWSEALDLIYARVSQVISQYGVQAVAPLNYSGPHGMLSGGSMDRRFFHRLGATELQRDPLCAGVWGEAYESLYGAVPGMSPELVVHSKLVVIWGNNTAVSNLHFHRLLKTARENGAKVVVVDPRKTKIASQADLHLALMPGTDVVLGLAAAALLDAHDAIDREFASEHIKGLDAYLDNAREWTPEKAASVCGLAADDIREFARLYGELSPAALSVGIGAERNRNGGSGVRAALALPALAGKFGVPGGGIMGKSSPAFPKRGDALTGAHLRREPTREVNILDVPTWITEPADGVPLRALFAYNHNAVAVHPDQNRLREALSHPDLFMVGIDVELNDTLRYADVILPACTHFEHADLYGAYGQPYLQYAAAVIPPVGEALSNMEIFRLLAARFGFGESEFRDTDEELMASALDWQHPHLQGTTLADLKAGKVQEMRLPDAPLMLFANLTPRTPSGKVELWSDALDAAYQLPLPVYQAPPQEGLVLLTPASNGRTNSTFGSDQSNRRVQVLQMHPVDAERLVLTEGSPVRVHNDLGEVVLKLQISEQVRPGVVSCDKGAWLDASETGQSCNALIPAIKADIGQGACYHDARVQVSPLTA